MPADQIIERSPAGDSGPTVPAGIESLPTTPEIDLISLLTILARAKRVILSTTAVAAVLAAIVSLLLPNHYQATTRILSPQQNQSLASALASPLGALGSISGASSAAQALGLKNPNEVYVTMLKSRTAEDDLIQRFDLLRTYRCRFISDARKRLEAASEISLGAKDGIITITVDDTDRKRAADLANAYVDELRNLTQTLAVTEAAQRRLFFEQEMERAKDKLSAAEQALKQTQQVTGIIQLDGQSRAIIESMVRLRAQVAAKEVELQAMRSFATGQNPDLLREEQELAGLRAQLTTFEKQGGGEGDVQVATGKVPQAGMEYVRRLRDVKYQETIFELLAKQYEAAKLDEAKSAAVIQVLDPAMAPDRKSSPRRSMIVLIVTLATFIGSAIYVLAARAAQNLLSDPAVYAQFEALRSEAFHGSGRRRPELRKAHQS